MDRLFKSRSKLVSSQLFKFFNKRKRDYQLLQADQQPRPYDLKSLSPNGRVSSIDRIGDALVVTCQCGSRVSVSEADAYLRLLTGVGCGSFTCDYFEPQDVWRHPQPAIELQASFLAFVKYHEHSRNGLLKLGEVRQYFTNLLWDSADLISGMWVFNYTDSGGVTLNGKSRSKLLRYAEDCVLSDHTGSSVIFSDLMLLHDISKLDLLKAMSISDSLQQLTEFIESEVTMKVHSKDSELAKHFSSTPGSKPNKSTHIFNELVVALRDAEVGAAIEMTEVSWDYQTSNLRKVLIARGVPGTAFTCRRQRSGLDGKEIPREERPMIVIKKEDFSGVNLILG